MILLFIVRCDRLLQPLIFHIADRAAKSCNILTETRIRSLGRQDLQKFTFGDALGFGLRPQHSNWAIINCDRELASCLGLPEDLADPIAQLALRYGLHS